MLSGSIHQTMHILVNSSMDNIFLVSPVSDSDHEQQEVNDSLSDEIVTGQPTWTIWLSDRLTF